MYDRIRSGDIPVCFREPFRLQVIANVKLALPKKLKSTDIYECGRRDSVARSKKGVVSRRGWHVKRRQQQSNESANVFFVCLIAMAEKSCQNDDASHTMKEREHKRQNKMKLMTAAASFKSRQKAHGGRVVDKDVFFVAQSQPK
jgi:hypothetical protein